MTFVGRPALLGRVRAALDSANPSLVRVSGARGAGKSSLVEHVLEDYDHVAYRAPPLPDVDQRLALTAELERARTERGLDALGGEPERSWSGLFEEALSLAGAASRPFVLVIDDVHRLKEARSRYLDSVLAALDSALEAGRQFHVVVIGPEAAMPDEDRLPPGTPDLIRVGPLPFRAATRLLPGSRPSDLLRAYGVFGGWPRVLKSLDRDVTVGTNVRRLLLAPHGSLADAGGRWLERDVQTPARYYAILATLCRGEADWASVHAGVPDLSKSGQVAPYLHRLEELGLITSRRSLDASPRARSRRYAIADPFLAFWTRFVFTTRQRRESGGTSDVYSDFISPRLDAHLATVFPLVCRQHMTHDSIETAGASAREVGSLWGPGYEIPVAGILGSGAAYYGLCHWGEITKGDEPLQRLDHQLRETRYAFGRERRLRLVFTAEDAPRWLQRDIARRDDALLIDAEDLVGG